MPIDCCGAQQIRFELKDDFIRVIFVENVVDNTLPDKMMSCILQYVYI